MSVGLEHSAALSVISIHKAYSLALYCLTLLHVQTRQPAKQAYFAVRF